MISPVQSALLRTLAFHDTWEHAPTRAEWIATLEASPSTELVEVLDAVAELQSTGAVQYVGGRYVFPDRRDLAELLREDEAWAPRKRRVARSVVRWLTRIGVVRFVALCNTTALGHARDESDLDFFVIVRHRALWQTRALATLPFKILHRRPSAAGERDAVCLSYFVSDSALDLASHMLAPDDPYFRYWFLSLLPVYDDGVSRELWQANKQVTSRHPFAHPWMIAPDVNVKAPRLRLSSIPVLESLAKRIQMTRFPSRIRELMNKDSRVMVTDEALKFHVDDGREEYRRRYEENCRKRGI